MNVRASKFPSLFSRRRMSLDSNSFTPSSARVSFKIVCHGLGQRAHLQLLRHDLRSETLFTKRTVRHFSDGGNDNVVLQRRFQGVGVAKLLGKIKQHPNL